MVASRIVAPHTKLATTRWWHTTTLAEDFGVADASEDDMYAAMDWLLARQDRVQNYGLLTDARGCPVAVSVHEGNVADSQTLMPEIQRLREDFGIEQLVMVGDRGMISNKAIAELRESDGIAWITALKSVSIRALVEQGQLQLDLFDERNLVELSSPDYPGERLVACRNPQLAKLRTHKREELLTATEGNLEKIQARVEAGKLAGQDEIGLRVGKIVNQYKMAKHFELAIGHNTFSFARKRDAIAAEAALDGIYIIRTSVLAAQMDAAECVRNYKSLANVERAFRSLKTIDLKVRPIHHRTADRVRAHIFLCMLAYYVEWHMREAWRELIFADAGSTGQGHARPGGAGLALQSGTCQGGPPQSPMRASVMSRVSRRSSACTLSRGQPASAASCHW